jgi:hypothetical protein
MERSHSAKNFEVQGFHLVSHVTASQRRNSLQLDIGDCVAGVALII